MHELGIFVGLRCHIKRSVRGIDYRSSNQLNFSRFVERCKIAVQVVAARYRGTFRGYEHKEERSAANRGPQHCTIYRSLNLLDSSQSLVESHNVGAEILAVAPSILVGAVGWKLVVSAVAIVK